MFVSLDVCLHMRVNLNWHICVDVDAKDNCNARARKAHTKAHEHNLKVTMGAHFQASLHTWHMHVHACI